MKITDEFDMGLIVRCRALQHGFEDMGKSNKRCYKSTSGKFGPLQSNLYDGRFRCPWYMTSDSSACRYAWFDCQYHPVEPSKFRFSANYREGLNMYWNTLFPLVVLVKVWPIPLLRTADSGYLTRRLG